LQSSNYSISDFAREGKIPVEIKTDRGQKGLSWKFRRYQLAIVNQRGISKDRGNLFEEFD
jgi:hypothetical protein